MQLFQDFSEIHLTEPTVLTIGTFDGVHRGHQSILDQLKSSAQELQAKSATIAFHPRPKTVFAPEKFGNDYLTTSEERIDLFEKMGLDVLVLIPFTLKFAQTTAYDFVKLLVDKLNIIQLCIGSDFALGKNREGNIERLAELGKEFNYSLCEITPFFLDGEIVSSTRIRGELLAGNVRQAAQLLGRYPSLTSKIIQGAQRGRTIGFPTANFFVPRERLLPANGVYATYVQGVKDNSQRLPSVTNIGVRPSFGEDERTVETFIFDFTKDLYGQTLTLKFVEHLRPETKFESIDALIAQIKQDAEQARNLLATEVVPAI